MAKEKEKACLNCKKVYKGDNCPNCGHNMTTEGFKGKMHIFDAKNSEIGNKLGVENEGEFANKTK